MNIKLQLKLFNIEFKENLLQVDNVEYHGVPRLIEELLPVLYDPKSVTLEQLKKPLYQMFRAVHRKDDQKLFEKFKLRYDVTVMAPYNLGPELPKTLGHYHPIAVEELSFMEVYEVLHGRAHYLLQHKPPRDEVDRVVLIEATPGDIVVIPPNYGHVTINAGGTFLVMSNLVASTFKSLYDEYLKRRGAIYYELIDGRLIFNKNYPAEVSLEKFSKPEEEFSLDLRADLYASFIENPERFKFLIDPRLWKSE